MGSEELMDDGRRRLMKAVASVGGAMGVGPAVTAIVPFVASMNPSERAKAAGAPVEVDTSLHDHLLRRVNRTLE